MGIFCLLWIPAFYLFRRSVFNEKDVMGWQALLLGCAFVIVRYFTGPFITPAGFGLSRWLDGFINIVSLPVILPVAVCVLLSALNLFSSDVDFGGFTFLWLVPASLYYSVAEPVTYSPLMLVLVPLLWTTQALGISFFIDCIIKYRRWYVIIPSIPAIIILPLIASTSWWAFFSQQTRIGCLSLFLSVIPALVSMIDLREKGRGIKKSAIPYAGTSEYSSPV